VRLLAGSVLLHLLLLHELLLVVLVELSHGNGLGRSWTRFSSGREVLSASTIVKKGGADETSRIHG
jgi:hypothetical protein